MEEENNWKYFFLNEFNEEELEHWEGLKENPDDVQLYTSIEECLFEKDLKRYDQNLDIEQTEKMKLKSRFIQLDDKQKKQQISPKKPQSNKNYWVLVIAAVIILLLIFWLIVNPNLLNKNTSPVLVKDSTQNPKQKEEKNIAKELPQEPEQVDQQENQDLPQEQPGILENPSQKELALDRRFLPNQELEDFIASTFRGEIDFIWKSPINRDTLTKAISFSWTYTGDKNLNILLVDNQNTTIFNKSLDPTTQELNINFDTQEAGLYYWKILAGTDRLHCGSFYWIPEGQDND